jgi:hypothetical protein
MLLGDPVQIHTSLRFFREDGTAFFNMSRSLRRRLFSRLQLA